MNDGKVFFIQRICVAILALLQMANSGFGQTIEWSRTLNNSDHHISADRLGSVYVAGLKASGIDNVALQRFSAAGDLIWSRTYGDVGLERVNDVSADVLGNVFFGGDLVSLSNGFVAKYDQSGNFLWDRMIGNHKGSLVYGVTADGLGNVYVAGTAREAIGSDYYGALDGFISKYDAAGNLSWARQIGTAHFEDFYDIAADNLGNIYAVGDSANLQTVPFVSEPLVSKFDAAGNLLWSKTYGTTNYDFAVSVDADSLGNVYISGASGNLSTGENRLFLSKLDSAGNLVWRRDLAAEIEDFDGSVATDGLGNAFVTGFIESSGTTESFVEKFDPAGNSQWNLPLGTFLSGVSSDRHGHLYVSGGVARVGPFVVKIFVPEPSAAAIVFCGGLLAAAFVRRHR
jgi:hypothetical protein